MNFICTVEEAGILAVSSPATRHGENNLPFFTSLLQNDMFWRIRLLVLQHQGKPKTEE
jgi:hypothetical protein